MRKELMKPFEQYAQSLEDLAESLLRAQKPMRKCYVVNQALNGQPAQKLRDAISLADRRAKGIFFTGARLARRVSNQLFSEIPSNALVADIGCGAGDLVLACARRLPLGSDLDETLKIWGDHLMGFDVHPAFIRTTKARLVLLAISRGATIQGSAKLDTKDIFPQIREHDFLAWPREADEATHVIINPPYNELVAPPECTWGNRKVSAAAVFVDACISNVCPGTKITAILPDVLRSGSYYEKWRQRIDSMSQNLKITTHGQFDKWTDVHVFVLTLSKANDKKNTRRAWWKSIRKAQEGRVGDRFKVHVGPVVPHRDAQKGPRVAYLHARNLPPWSDVRRIEERRKFDGTLFEPPFVAVRRTSRPGDKRAIASIVIGKRKIAVENHLIALFPSGRTVRECKELVKVLKSPDTDRWLDRRIRCRHLTVQSLRELPWWSGSQ
jgi:hypothetical protein